MNSTTLVRPLPPLDGEVELGAADADRAGGRGDPVGVLVALAGDEAERAGQRVDRELLRRAVASEEIALDHQARAAADDEAGLVGKQHLHFAIEAGDDGLAFAQFGAPDKQDAVLPEAASRLRPDVGNVAK